MDVIAVVVFFQDDEEVDVVEDVVDEPRKQSAGTKAVAWRD